MILDNPDYSFTIDPPEPVTDQMDRGAMMLTHVRVTLIDGDWRADLTGYKVDKKGKRKTTWGWPIYHPALQEEAIDAFIDWLHRRTVGDD